MKVFLGFDPGGEGHFGWAVCRDGYDGLSVIDAGRADHAKGAMEQSFKALLNGGSVAGAGIDAPMFWVSDGGREADNLVRKAIRHLAATSPGGTVQHFNSLRGACVIQGLLVFKLLRREYPNLPITEAHPKALLWLMGIARKRHDPALIKARDIKGIIIEGDRFVSEDERDVILAALTAKEMIGRKYDWIDLLEFEKEPFLAGEHPIGYWMPIKLAAKPPAVGQCKCPCGCDQVPKSGIFIPGHDGRISGWIRRFEKGRTMSGYPQKVLDIYNQWKKDNRPGGNIHPKIKGAAIKVLTSKSHK